MSAQEAAKYGIFDLDTGTFMDAATRQAYSYKDAVKRGLLIQPYSAHVQDPATGTMITC